MRTALRRLCVAGVLAATASGPLLLAQSARATTCAELTDLSLANMKIQTSADVSAGSFTVAGVAGKPMALTVPEFCRVQVQATPTPDSAIGFEVWLPSQHAWNGKLLGIGNGGYSSVPDYAAMVDGLNRGYAVAATNQGHEGEDLRFVIGHPTRIEDWADRAIHVMTVGAKAIVRDRNGAWPARSYFDGCSTGGFQGMVETQRHPADYDGVIAGAPGYPRTSLSASFLAAWIVNHDEHGNEILPRSKLAMINKSAIAACDALDGVTDGLIADPRACRVEPATLLCKGADGADCLTAPQADVVRKIYAGPHSPHSGEPLFPGWDPGSEAPGGDPQIGWTAYIVGQPEPVRLELWKFWLFGDPHFDWHTFNFDRDLAAAAEQIPSMNAVNPKLDAFQAHGGKLLMYHGWADNVSSARGSIDYYNSVERSVGDRSETQEFFRLFLMPGMGHCHGGPGPDTFDRLKVLDDWVEHGSAPDRIVASHMAAGKIDRTRPLCPYPQSARYNGTGSTDEAANFTCADQAQTVLPSDGIWLTRLQQVYEQQPGHSQGGQP